MRKIAITKINASSPLGSIEVANDFAGVFQGKFYRHPTTGAVVPFYTTPAPAGYTLVRATTFEIVENAKYSGRYTVYTPAAAQDTQSSVYTQNTNPVGIIPGGRTRITVNEPIATAASGDAATLTSAETPATQGAAGYITNISTYLLYTGSGNIVVPPAVDITIYPVELMGRDSAGWGEAFAQNFVNLARNFASTNAPANPFVGQMWFDTDDQQMRVWNGTSWDLMNRASFGTTFRHTQGTAAKTWTVNHGLGFPPPYIGFCQFFVDRGNGPQIIIPADVQFVNGNQLQVTFSNPEVGYVMVRQ